MEPLQWLVRSGEGPILIIQVFFMFFAIMHVTYAGWHVRRHPVERETVNRRWRRLLIPLGIPLVYVHPLFTLAGVVMGYEDEIFAVFNRFPIYLFLMMPLVAYYYRSRDEAGMWGAVAILGFYLLLMLVALYGFDAMGPYEHMVPFEN